MQIVVCVKHVPDVESERGFAGPVVDRSQDMVLNEIDENAVEAAVELAEEHGGTVIALSMAPDDGEDTIRRALQLGADTGVLVSDGRAAGSDVMGTAQVLAAAITRIANETPVDLVVTGMSALDSQTSMLPAALAAYLGWPQLTLARAISVQDGQVSIERVLDDAVEQMRGPTPAVISVSDEANDVRMPGFKSIMAAKKATVTRWDLDDLGIDPAGVGQARARMRVIETTRLAERPAGEIVTDTGDGGRRLAHFLLSHPAVKAGAK